MEGGRGASWHNHPVGRRCRAAQTSARTSEAMFLPVLPPALLCSLAVRSGKAAALPCQNWGQCRDAPVRWLAVPAGA